MKAGDLGRAWFAKLSVLHTWSMRMRMIPTDSLSYKEHQNDVQHLDIKKWGEAGTFENWRLVLQRAEYFWILFCWFCCWGASKRKRLDLFLNFVQQYRIFVIIFSTKQKCQRATTHWSPKWGACCLASSLVASRLRACFVQKVGSPSVFGVLAVQLSSILHEKNRRTMTFCAWESVTSPARCWELEPRIFKKLRNVPEISG